MFIHTILDYILLFISFVFNFFIPGYVIIKTFFSTEKQLSKLSIYMFVGVISSTCLIYILALFFGLSDKTIFISYGLWSSLLFFSLVKNKKNNFTIKSSGIYFAAILVFFIFCLALKNAIFYKYQNYYVMSADNWQDTALHLSIIETIKEGNFPPKAPYFSGRGLKYHYFTDLHSAILTYPLHEFTPRILIFDNALFAAIFFLSIYDLTFLVTDSRRSSIYASILATFSGSLIFINFVRDFINGQGSLKDLILTGKYVLEYGQLFQMAPITNYFLQNRPMMVGMTSVSVSIYSLFLYLSLKNDRKYIYFTILIGLLSINFQLICSLIIFTCILITLFINNPKKLIFTAPFVLVLVFGLKNYLNLFLQNFSFGPWVNNGTIWVIKFVFANLGVPFVMFLILVLLILFKRIFVNWKIKYLIAFFILIFLIPLVCSFTIDKADMLKFFYILFIPLSIFASIVIDRIYKKRFGRVFATFLILASVLTGIIDLAGSILNKNLGYTIADLNSGLWIRDNTVKKSVFVTAPTVHSPVSDIGGRLRVLSYINWPYTHGYNNGQDNVFTRLEDTERFFNFIDNEAIALTFFEKYHVKYVFFGPQELSNFPEAKNKLESSKLVKKIYDQEDIKIY